MHGKIGRKEVVEKCFSLSSHRGLSDWLSVISLWSIHADNPLLFHMLRDGLQHELFHHLSRDGGEADWLVVPQVFLLALS